MRINLKERLFCTNYKHDSMRPNFCADATLFFLSFVVGRYGRGTQALLRLCSAASAVGQAPSKLQNWNAQAATQESRRYVECLFFFVVVVVSF